MGICSRRIGDRRSEGAIPVAQHHAYGIGPGGRHYQIRLAVPIEVACRNTVGVTSHRILHLRLEGAIAVAQQYAHIVAGGAGAIYHREVRPAILVVVPHRDRLRISARRVSGLRLEGAIAVTQKDAYGGGVCHRQVQLAVSVEVSYSNEIRIGPRGVGDRRLEGAVAISQQDTEPVCAAASIVHHGKVRLAIPVEVPDRYEFGVAPNRIRVSYREGAIAISKVDAYCAGAFIYHHHVLLSVFVQIPDGYPIGSRTRCITSQRREGQRLRSRAQRRGAQHEAAVRGIQKRHAAGGRQAARARNCPGERVVAHRTSGGDCRRGGKFRRRRHYKWLRGRRGRIDRAIDPREYGRITVAPDAGGPHDHRRSRRSQLRRADQPQAGA